MSNIDPVRWLEGLVMLVAADQDEKATVRADSIPYHGTALESSEDKFQRFLDSPNEARIHNRLRMSKRVFLSLVGLLEERSELEATASCSIGQQLAMWIQAWAHGTSVRGISEEFQHSTETVSRYVSLVMKELCRLSPSFVKLPNPRSIPKEIRKNSKFYPYFKDCLGALDGSFIQGIADPRNEAAYRGRKGVGMNVLFACTFDLRFCYALPGWEASVHDSTVLSNAMATRSFVVPEGKYYLGDAGYLSTEYLLTPYRGVRYHLNEQGRAGVRPENLKEIYNLRHSMLRNAVEQIIGLLKRRFRALGRRNEYSVEKQAQGIYAAVMLHNYLQSNSEVDQLENKPIDSEINESNGAETEIAETSLASDNLMSQGAQLREAIAKSMWADYSRRRS